MKNRFKQTPNPNPKGFVYIMAAILGKETYCKVGYSINPQRRLKEIQTGFPEELALLTTQPACPLIEKRTHYILNTFRSKGEWFKCEPETALQALAAAITNNLEERARILALSPPKHKRKATRKNGKDNAKSITNKTNPQTQAYLTRSDRNKPLTFGKHKGFTLIEISKINPNYIKWLAKNDIQV